MEVVGVIDTGFTGFVLLPAQYALSLNLKVQTTTTVTLADESQCVCLLAEASVSLDATTSRQGLVMLEKNCKEVLIGMDFLRQFGLGLALFSKSIALIDESKMEAALRTSSTPPTPPEEPKRNKR